MVTGPITIRQATAEDIPFLQEMIWEAMLASPTFLALHGVETMRQAEKQYWERWPEHPDPAFVALDGSGQRLGAMTVKPNDTQEPARGWRIGLAMQAHVRGQGLGQRLLERAIIFAREKGANYVNLFVDPTNTRAIALYRRVGFIEVGEKDQMLEMRINLRS
ncbi:MAG: GNAT family N-acetyltransferase [Ktedonobacteraceae bacterium]